MRLYGGVSCRGTGITICTGTEGERSSDRTTPESVELFRSLDDDGGDESSMRESASAASRKSVFGGEVYAGLLVVVSSAFVHRSRRLHDQVVTPGRAGRHRALSNSRHRRYESRRGDYDRVSLGSGSRRLRRRGAKWLSSPPAESWRRTRRMRRNTTVT
ncbi:hypothetical protein MTO96_008339 [Rhipicephalus appendiculatus]